VVHRQTLKGYLSQTASTGQWTGELAQARLPTYMLPVVRPWDQEEPKDGHLLTNSQKRRLWCGNGGKSAVKMFLPPKTLFEQGNCRTPQGDKEPMKEQWQTTPSSAGSLGNYRLVKIVERKCQSKTKGPGGKENGAYGFKDHIRKC